MAYLMGAPFSQRVVRRTFSLLQSLLHHQCPSPLPNPHHHVTSPSPHFTSPLTLYCTISSLITITLSPSPHHIPHHYTLPPSPQLTIKTHITPTDPHFLTHHHPYSPSLPLHSFHSPSSHLPLQVEFTVVAVVVVVQ